MFELKGNDSGEINGQELRAAAANVEPKHEKEIAALISSYKSLYSKWIFELRYALIPMVKMQYSFVWSSLVAIFRVNSGFLVNLKLMNLQSKSV